MINQNCHLLLKDLYSYDIKGAYPTILGKQHFDFKNIDLDNKEERSIFIGKQQIDNVNLSTFLQESVDNLVKFYLQENNVSDEETIVTQKDGFIITKMLENNDEFIEMKFREFIDFLLFTPDRKKYLYLAGGTVTVKGMPFLYSEMENLYQTFSNLGFYDKSTLFEQMASLKKEFYTTENKKLFLIPKEEKSFIVLTHKGDIEIKDPDMVSMSQINRIRYYNHYLKDFLWSIYLECY